MNPNYKRRGDSNDPSPKRMKKECSYGEGCYRKNPAHFREFSHPHLESIIDNYSGTGDYPVPQTMWIQRDMIKEQIDIIIGKNIYVKDNIPDEKKDLVQATTSKIQSSEPEQSKVTDVDKKTNNLVTEELVHKKEKEELKRDNNSIKDQTKPVSVTQIKHKDSDYRPIVPPTRRVEEFLKVVVPKGQMAEKHAKSAPYFIFYTTITSARETHRQPLSITFQEILDLSLGELKCSLQINFMVELGWLLAQYYFAGYSAKRLTILYGEDSEDLRNISKKKPNVDAHMVSMATPFGKHHTKMMILCYEDGSLRVVISTANLYYDDWENRTQGLWLSPKCPELPDSAMPFDGESPTLFKKSLLKYLNHYHMPQLSYYVERVKRCDFTHINVFLVASVPGGHLDPSWGMKCVGSLLRQHCTVPCEDDSQWELLTQASSIGSFGKDAKQWLMGDFHHNFCKIQNPSKLLATKLAKLKIIYPSLENVKESHDGLLGGGCLPYAASAHQKQPWLMDYLYQWKALSSGRNRAMPHIKSYCRYNNGRAAFYLLTSANISKAAWGVVNKGNGALRIMSYEAGVLFLPKFVINKDYFSIDKKEEDSVYIPYDIPPTKYTENMSAWVSDYLM